MAPRRHTFYRRRPNLLVKDFTTNPTLMRAAGVKDYEAFAHEILAVVTDKLISLRFLPISSTRWGGKRTLPHANR
jgi:hypothetical protein